MKRLLAYLFIVLGLGLLFSVNANAENTTCYGLSKNYKFFKIFRFSRTCNAIVETVNIRGKKYLANTWAGYIMIDAKTFHKVESLRRNVKAKLGGESEYLKDYDKFLAELIQGREKFLIEYLENNQTQIAKAEPSQTQEVRGDKFELIVCGPVEGSSVISAFKKKELSKGLDSCERKRRKNLLINYEANSLKDKICYQTRSSVILVLQDYMDIKKCEDYNKVLLNPYWVTLHYDGKYFSWGKQKTQIAKAEPSQTQEVAKKIVKEEIFSVCTKGREAMGSYTIYYYSSLKQYQRKNPIGCNIIVEKTKAPKLFKEIKVFFDKKSSGNTHVLMMQNKFNSLINRYVDKYAERNIMIRGYSEKINYVDSDKTKVAKVEEPKQEEFKPETGDIDNDAPVIQIAEAITFNDSDYEFEGQVTDKSKQIFVEVDGRLVNVKNGKFTVKGYSPVDKEISIEAIDGHGNRSKPKIVKILIDIKDTVIAEKLEPLNPTKIRSKSSNNKVALIIGIANYTESPNAQFANLDAKYFFDYARKAFGVKKQNIKMLIDEEATFVKTNKAITKWLKGKIINDKSELIIFFAGHGLASSDGKELFLLSQDSDPDMLSITALSRTKLFETIIGLNPKSVTMFLDTCYSGVSRDEQMLLASARPIRIVADEQEGIPDNFTIFSASQLDQISSGLKEANHGIFSYYLMKGLEGNADGALGTDKDYKITNGELLAYMDLNVSQKASVLGREQNPSLNGDPDKILISYR